MAGSLLLHCILRYMAGVEGRSLTLQSFDWLTAFGANSVMSNGSVSQFTTLRIIHIYLQCD
jgi:hypothetical protein